MRQAPGQGQGSGQGSGAAVGQQTPWERGFDQGADELRFLRGLAEGGMEGSVGVTSEAGAGKIREGLQHGRCECSCGEGDGDVSGEGSCPVRGLNELSAARSPAGLDGSGNKWVVLAALWGSEGACLAAASGQGGFKNGDGDGPVSHMAEAVEGRVGPAVATAVQGLDAAGLLADGDPGAVAAQAQSLLDAQHGAHGDFNALALGRAHLGGSSGEGGVDRLLFGGKLWDTKVEMRLE